VILLFSYVAQNAVVAVEAMQACVVVVTAIVSIWALAICCKAVCICSNLAYGGVSETYIICKMRQAVSNFYLVARTCKMASYVHNMPGIYGVEIEIPPINIQRGLQMSEQSSEPFMA
jgi:hypothetical protein